MRRVLAGLFAITAAGCIPPGRDNPFDPQGNVQPRIEVLQPYAISCGQWEGEFPLPPGFAPGLLSAEESEEIDAICESACAFANVSCQTYEVLTSQVRTPVVECTQTDNIVELRYNEILYVSDEERRIEISLPNVDDLRFEAFSEGGFFSIDPDDFEVEEQSFFEYGTRYQEVGGNQVTAAAYEAFGDRVLLTRPLYSVDRNQLAMSLSDGFGENRVDCRVEVRFDQATDILSHPLAFGGGYGRHVAIADLRLDDDYDPTISRLDFATTYAAAEDLCFIDVVFRNSPSGDLTHAPREGTFYGLEVACDADGQPPPVAGGRFLSNGAEGFAVPYRDVGELFVSLVGPDYDPGDPIEIDVPEFFEVPGFPGTPRELECLGNQFGSEREEIGLVPANGSHILVCNPVNETGNCAYLPAPDCLGAPSRWIDLAGKPHDVEVDRLLAAAQSSNGTCIVWMDPSSAFSVVREETFATLEPVTVQWATRSGAPSAIAVGYLDAADPTSMAFELPDGGGEWRFSLIDNGECLPSLTGTSNGLGSSVLTETIVDCATDGSGCERYSYRAVGVPGFEYATDDDLDGEFEVIPDEGAIAYWGFGCADPADVYYVHSLPFLGQIYPTSIAASLAAALDVNRSRQASSSVCQVPSTIVLGAPADGELGGTGRMVVVYNSGDTLRTEPFCTPVFP